ncbi:MAG TPA: methyltransferase domain-containing protein, partial [Acidimicrobiales bacterium]
CGQGLATRALAGAGATDIVGVDSSEAMLELARQRTQDHRISYVHDDAQTLASMEDTSFDGAVCQLGLMDIPDLDATIVAIHRVLKPHGWFVFVIGHPCVLVPDAVIDRGADGRPGVRITGYFDERFWRSSNPNGVRRAGNHHRTLGTYLNTLLDRGFQVERVEEPPASTRLAQQNPLYREVPIFFAARVRKPRS